MIDLESAVSSLTPKEKPVFYEMVRLHSHKEIAEILNVDVRTVKFHVGNIYKKMGIKTCNAGSNSKRLLFTRMTLPLMDPQSFEAIGA